ncbi:MAG: hypothetical protein U0989_01625 [Azonexus sp.]|nr:hypothetical protein [Azonexus sp.]
MNETNPARGKVMRPGLAGGCSRWMPIDMSTPVNKAAQGNVAYRAAPNGVRRCVLCLNFIGGSNACQVVEGQISPDAWCTVWVRRS